MIGWLRRRKHPFKNTGRRPMTDARQNRARMSSREWIIVLLLVVSAVINYVDRTNLSMAIPQIEQRFALSPLQVASLLGAFFWTYALLQLFGLVGWLTDRFQPGWVLFYGYLLWTIATGLTGLATSFTAVFLLRLLLGIGESVAYPCYSRIFAGMPHHYRGRANAAIDAGTKMGPAAGVFIAGLILAHLGWRMLFIIFGVGGLLWLLPWGKVMPHVEQQEGHALTQDFLEARHSMVNILKRRSAWGTFIGHFCGNYFYYFLLAWLPRYLVQEEHLSVEVMSNVTSAVFFLMGCSTLIAGWFSDRMVARGVSPSIARRGVAAGGLGLAACLVFSGLLMGHPVASLMLLAISCIGYGAFSSNHWAITQTLAGPAMAGRWSSLQNGLANFSGVIAPWVAGLILTRQGNSRLAFSIAGAMALIGAFAYGVLVHRVERVNWNED
jgi:MFS transporter, ACS family, D-galactonate transporter